MYFVGMVMRWREQLSQTTLPHFLQWCLRNQNENSCLQYGQCDTAASGCHGGSTMGDAAPGVVTGVLRCCRCSSLGACGEEDAVRSMAVAEDEPGAFWGESVVGEPACDLLVPSLPISSDLEAGRFLLRCE